MCESVSVPYMHIWDIQHIEFRRSCLLIACGYFKEINTEKVLMFFSFLCSSLSLSVSLVIRYKFIRLMQTMIKLNQLHQA